VAPSQPQNGEKVSKRIELELAMKTSIGKNPGQKNSQREVTTYEKNIFPWEK